MEPVVAMCCLGPPLRLQPASRQHNALALLMLTTPILCWHGPLQPAMLGSRPTLLHSLHSSV